MYVCVCLCFQVVQGKSARKQKLKVFSFTQKEEKVLPGDMAGKFTTNPKLAQFYLPDVIKYVPEPFPASVRLFLEAEDAVDASLLPDSLRKEVVVLLDSTIKTSLIASYSQETETGGSKDLTVELPISEDILVSIPYQSYLNESASFSLDRLHKRTLSVWSDLMSPSPAGDPTAHPKLLHAGGDTARQRLFSMVRAGWEKEGQGIKLPQLLKNSLADDLDASAQYQGLGLTDVSRGSSEYMPLLTSSLSSDYYSTTEDDSVSVGGKDTDDVRRSKL